MRVNQVRLRAAAVLDPRGIAGSALGSVPWAPGCDPLAGRLEAPPGTLALPARELRRLDLLTQALLLCAAAAGVEAALAPAERRETALILASREGCLEADLAFQASLAPGAAPAPALFPWTLPSTCLGELALRLRLMGPTLCLGAETAPEAGLALSEARALLSAGEAEAAVVAFGGVLSRAGAAELGSSHAGAPAESRLQLGLVVLGRGSAPAIGPDPGDLQAAGDPWSLLRAAWEAAA